MEPNRYGDMVMEAAGVKIYTYFSTKSAPLLGRVPQCLTYHFAHCTYNNTSKPSMMLRYKRVMSLRSHFIIGLQLLRAPFAGLQR